METTHKRNPRALKGGDILKKDLSKEISCVHVCVFLCVLFFIIGLILMVHANSIEIPSPYKTFLGIPYATNPEFASSFEKKLAISMIGVFSFGMSAGSLISVFLVRLDKKSKSSKT